MKQRTEAILAVPEARAQLAKLWPTVIPTFKYGGPTNPVQAAQLDEVLKLVEHDRDRGHRECQGRASR